MCVLSSATNRNPPNEATPLSTKRINGAAACVNRSVSLRREWKREGIPVVVDVAMTFESAGFIPVLPPRQRKQSAPDRSYPRIPALPFAAAGRVESGFPVCGISLVPETRTAVRPVKDRRRYYQQRGRTNKYGNSSASILNSRGAGCVAPRRASKAVDLTVGKFTVESRVCMLRKFPRAHLAVR